MCPGSFSCQMQRMKAGLEGQFSLSPGRFLPHPPLLDTEQLVEYNVIRFGLELQPDRPFSLSVLQPTFRTSQPFMVCYAESIQSRDPGRYADVVRSTRSWADKSVRVGEEPIISSRTTNALSDHV